MNKHLTKLVVMLGVFAAGLIGLNRVENVSAVDDAKYGFRVIPASIKVDFEPGDTYTNKMTITNLGKTDTEYRMVAYPYSIDDTGDTKLDVENDHTLIKDWVTFTPSTGTIAANESIEITYTIKIPTDVPAGGQYAALAVEGTDGSGNLGTTLSVSTVLYSNVNGETRTDGKVVAHDTNGFLFTPPISVTSTIENSGNTHFTAEYVLKVYPFFSDESIYNTEENPDEVTVIPGSKRFKTVSWDTSPSIGIFKVVSEINYLGKTDKIEKMVIICPAWVLILILVFIFAVIFWLVSRSRARKQNV